MDTPVICLTVALALPIDGAKNRFIPGDEFAEPSYNYT